MLDSASLAEVCHQHQAVVIEHSSLRTRIATLQTTTEGLLAALASFPLPNMELEIWSASRLSHWQQQQGHRQVPDPQPVEFSSLQAILSLAIVHQASDIHIEPSSSGYHLRLRIDGVLQQSIPLCRRLSAQIVARIKVLAKLDMAEKRLPQDGQFDYQDGQQTVSVRVSSLLCRLGEKLVLRLFPSVIPPIEINHLGLQDTDRDSFTRALSYPTGLILLSGPTGSGKTQTLYSALAYLNSPSSNICTIEDPIEIPIAGLNQTQLHLKAGLDYPTILRGLLRQDPDIIMLGEIRDEQTAKLAVKAALTGHLVLSTIHSHSASGIVTRLKEMAQPSWMLAASLRLLMTQRLVRKLCPHCKRPPQHSAKIPSWSAVGCHKCHAGYAGRFALYELLPITASRRELIYQSCSEAELASCPEKKTMNTLRTHGLRAIEQGLTSLDELNRVLGDQDE